MNKSQEIYYARNRTKRQYKMFTFQAIHDKALECSEKLYGKKSFSLIAHMAVYKFIRDKGFIDLCKLLTEYKMYRAMTTLIQLAVRWRTLERAFMLVVRRNDVVANSGTSLLGFPEHPTNENYQPSGKLRRRNLWKPILTSVNTQRDAMPVTIMPRKKVCAGQALNAGGSRHTSARHPFAIR